MILLNFTAIMNSYSQEIIAVALFLIILLAILIWLIWSKLKKAASLLAFNNSVLTGLTPEQGIEKHLNQYLEMIMPIIKAEGYYFYLFDTKSDHYVLRVNRHAGSNPGLIAPNYSALVPYDKEKYNPPLGLPGPNQVDGVSMIKDGEVPLVQITVTGGGGVIRIGPVKDISSKDRSILYAMSEILKPAMTMLLSIEKQKHDVGLLMATSKAINGLARTSFDVDSLRSRMMLLGANMIEAKGCCLIVNQNGKYEVPIVSGLEIEIETQFLRDYETLANLYNFVRMESFYHLTPGAEEFSRIPFYLVAAGLKTILLFKVSGRTFTGTAVFWLDQEATVDQHRATTLKMLLKRLGNIYDQKSKYKELADSYVGALRTLLEATDNIEPQTVGHSNLIANYSVAIAKELKLSVQDVQEIKLAGYFHDVGMLGLTSDILFKPGAYTPLETETMKLHAEVGAAVGESALGNANVSSYIRHHHERWDGYGYPQGLRGEEIPLGARIIAVADMFNAKLGGRKYRDPVSFERAVTDLSVAAGTQLDPVAVEALLSWFRNKQTDLSRQGRTLGACWEMRCCPPSIHKQCIVFNTKSDKNCWEFEGVNCTAHGNTCATCFVRTEALLRIGQKSPYSLLQTVE